MKKNDKKGSNLGSWVYTVLASVSRVEILYKS